MRKINRLSFLLVSFFALACHATSQEDCSYAPALNAILQDAHNLSTIDTKLNELFFNQQGSDAKCAWINKMNAYVADVEKNEAEYVDFPARCDKYKKVTEFYLNEINALLASQCTNVSCEDMLDQFSQLTAFQRAGNQLMLNSPQLQVQLTSTQSTPVLNKVELKRVPLESICGDFNLSFLFVGAFPNDQQTPLNVIIDQNTPEEIRKLKYQPLQANVIFDNLYQDSYFVFDYSEHPEWLTDKYFSYSQTFYTFTGGAHGATTIGYINYDLRRQKLLTLEDIFRVDNKNELLKRLKEAFKQDNEITTEEDFISYGFGFRKESIPKERAEWSLDDGFYLPENFLLNDDGIHFIYQSYEIAPYSAGLPSFHASWEALAQYLLIQK